MIETISLCPTCYKKIPASIYPKDGQAIMDKECDVHGKFTALVEKSWKHVSNFYKQGTLGRNNIIIIHIHDTCNMQCPWCYYESGHENIRDFQFYDQLLHDMYKGHSLLLSGGEPTLRPDYFSFVHDAKVRGWRPSTITNMIKIGDGDFFKQTLNDDFVDENNNYKFAMSFQHPKNYSKAILKEKMAALDNMGKEGLKAECMMFSIQSLDELDFIKEFYDSTRDLYNMFRIRTLFNNWGNSGRKRLFLSQLHDAFLEKFAEYTPIQSNRVEQSNMYGMYMETKEARDISLMSAPNVRNIDYHLCSRPVHMLGLDLRCYPVPICQIVSEGISKGWKDGFKIGGNLCG